MSSKHQKGPDLKRFMVSRKIWVRASLAGVVKSLKGKQNVQEVMCSQNIT